MNESDPNFNESPENFGDETTTTKSPVSTVIRSVVWHVNKSKLNYNDLRYIFRRVRELCEIEVPRTPKRLIELPTREEIRRFYNAIEDPVHRLLFETLEGTGLRIAELCNLEVTRIDFAANTFFVSEGKGKRDRIVVFGNRLKEKLRLYLEGRKNRFLFESNRNWKFSTRRVEQLCEEYRAMSAIVKNLTPHTFRHIFNTRLAEADVPKEKRAILAGHADDKTQDVYTHLAVGGFKDQIINILDK